METNEELQSEGLQLKRSPKECMGFVLEDIASLGRRIKSKAVEFPRRKRLERILEGVCPGKKELERIEYQFRDSAMSYVWDVAKSVFDTYGQDSSLYQEVSAVLLSANERKGVQENLKRGKEYNWGIALMENRRYNFEDVLKLYVIAEAVHDGFLKGITPESEQEKLEYLKQKTEATKLYQHLKSKEYTPRNDKDLEEKIRRIKKIVPEGLSAPKRVTPIGEMEFKEAYPTGDEEFNPEFNGLEGTLELKEGVIEQKGDNVYVDDQKRTYAGVKELSDGSIDLSKSICFRERSNAEKQAFLDGMNRGMRKDGFYNKLKMARNTALGLGVAAYLLYEMLSK